MRTSLDARWADILKPRSTPELGLVLASHERCGEFTEVLLRGLTVQKLIRLANVQHNKCRLSQWPTAAAERLPDLAWQALRHGMANMQMRDSTAWTGTAKLLKAGAPEGLERVKQLSIGPVIAVCESLIAGPYREANRRGLT